MERLGRLNRATFIPATLSTKSATAITMKGLLGCPSITLNQQNTNAQCKRIFLKDHLITEPNMPVTRKRELPKHSTKTSLESS